MSIDNRMILERRRILIVDDDPDVRESIETAFQSEGARTKVCSDGNTAVRICLEDKPDAVILDMMLPGRSGFLVLEKIKGYEDSPIVIMITANEGIRHREFAEGLGADLYVQKPMSLPQLIESAAELLDRERPLSEMEEEEEEEEEVEEDAVADEVEPVEAVDEANEEEEIVEVEPKPTKKKTRTRKKKTES